MPRRIAGSNSNIPIQANRTQSSARQVTPPPAEQSSASQASGASSAQVSRSKEKGKAAQLRMQMEAANRAEAQEWKIKLKEICNDLHILNETKKETLIPLKDKSEGWMQERNQDNDEQMLEKRLKEGTSLVGKLETAISDFYEDTGDEVMANIFRKAVSTIKDFDAIPIQSKDRLLRNDDIKSREEIAKSNYMICKRGELLSRLTLIDTQCHVALDMARLLDLKNDVLEKDIDKGKHPGSLQRDFEQLLLEYAKSSQYVQESISKGIKTKEACESLLADTYSNHGLNSHINKDHLFRAHNIISYLHFAAMQVAFVKALISIIFLTRDSVEKQENENLQKWHELTRSSLQEGYNLAGAVNEELLCQDTWDHTQESVKKLGRVELEQKQEVARDAQSQVEKFIRHCEKRTQEYDNLEGVEKDDRVSSVLRDLKNALTGFLKSREYAVQFWADRIQALEEINNSFLPKNLQKNPSGKRANERHSLQQPSMLPEPSQKSGWHKTIEGTVFGRINEQGGLDALNKNGKIINTYFEDKDSGKWVRDYGDDADIEQQAISTMPSDEAVVREKAERLVQKANNIAKASMRFSRKALDDVTASNDYDDKINWLQHAFSEKAKAVTKIKNLRVELEELSIEDQSGKNFSAILGDHWDSLRADKEELDEKLQQAQQTLNLHSHKRRDPTGSNFRFLWEQGQVASIVKEFHRRKNRNDANDLLDRYVISFTQGAQGEQYEPWIVHAHYHSAATSAEPVRVHMKRNAEKDWGVEQQAYHSLPLNQATFNLVKQGVQKQEAAPSVKKGHRRRR